MENRVKIMKGTELIGYIPKNFGYGTHKLVNKQNAATFENDSGVKIALYTLGTRPSAFWESERKSAEAARKTYVGCHVEKEIIS